jgi:hypothetical protein
MKFEFRKRSQLFIRPHSKPFSIATIPPLDAIGPVRQIALESFLIAGWLRG